MKKAARGRSSPSCLLGRAAGDGDAGGRISDNLSWQILEIFGATGEDAEGLRIKTLSELEAEDFESLLESSEGDAQD